jgi:hypothetical protein
VGSKKKAQSKKKSGAEQDRRKSDHGSKKSRKTRAREYVEVREVEVSVPAVADVDLDVRDLQARLEVLQQQFGGVVAALGESTTRLQAAVALIADLPTRDAATDSARELRQRLEQMLVAQQRTNELLDLALGVAVAPDASPHGA